MSEVWKDIEGYEGIYQVSNLGRIRSLDRMIHGAYGRTRFSKGKIIKCHITRNGYINVILRKRNFLVHRIVAKTFLPNPENKTVVDHIDTVKSNNNVDNLRWVTTSENISNPITKNRMDKARKRGEKSSLWHWPTKKGSFLITRSKGKAHYKSKAVLQYDLHNNLIAEYDTVTEAAIQFGSFIATNISYCCKGKRKTAFGYKWKYKE